MIVTILLTSAVSLLVGYVIGKRRGRTTLNRELETLSEAVSETGKSSDSLAESISRNKQTKDKYNGNS